MVFYTPGQDRIALGDGLAFDPGLPTALLIGDSISIGYTQPTRDALAGTWNIVRAPDNCGDTEYGLANIDGWLANREWDVIHFNWGLHDLCYRHPEATATGNRDKVRGVISVALDRYRENLDQLVTRLRQAARVLVWASTSVVPPGEAGRYEGDEVRYNAAAAEIMARHRVVTNDLHALTAGLGPDSFVDSGDVHFTARAYRIIGHQVAERIATAWRARDPASSGAVGP